MKHSDGCVYICQTNNSDNTKHFKHLWTWSQEAKFLLTVPIISPSLETLGFTCKWAFVYCFTPFKELNYLCQDKTIRSRFCLLKPSDSFASSVYSIRGSHVVKSHHALHVASSSLLKLPHHRLQSSHATFKKTKTKIHFLKAFTTIIYIQRSSHISQWQCNFGHFK